MHMCACVECPPCVLVLVREACRPVTESGSQRPRGEGDEIRVAIKQGPEARRRRSGARGAARQGHRRVSMDAQSPLRGVCACSVACHGAARLSGGHPAETRREQVN